MKRSYSGKYVVIQCQDLKLQSDNIVMISSDWNFVTVSGGDRWCLAAVMYDALMENYAVRASLTDKYHVDHFKRLGFKQIEGDLYEWRKSL